MCGDEQKGQPNMSVTITDDEKCKTEFQWRIRITKGIFQEMSKKQKWSKITLEEK